MNLSKTPFLLGASGSPQIWLKKRAVCTLTSCMPEDSSLSVNDLVVPIWQQHTLSLALRLTHIPCSVPAVQVHPWVTKASRALLYCKCSRNPQGRGLKHCPGTHSVVLVSWKTLAHCQACAGRVHTTYRLPSKPAVMAEWARNPFCGSWPPCASSLEDKTSPSPHSSLLLPITVCGGNITTASQSGHPRPGLR